MALMYVTMKLEVGVCVGDTDRIINECWGDQVRFLKVGRRVMLTISSQSIPIPIINCMYENIVAPSVSSRLLRVESERLTIYLNRRQPEWE